MLYDKATSVSVKKVTTKKFVKPTALKSYRVPDKKEEQSSSLVTCKKCGKANHTTEKCFVKNLSCDFCKREGHIASVCFKKRRYDKKRQSTVKVLEPEDSVSQIFPIDKLHRISSAGDDKYPPLYLPVVINNVLVDLEHNTGCRNTVISRQVYEKVAQNEPLKATSVTFRDYSQNIVIPEGVLTVKAEYGGKLKNLDVFVVSNSYSCLLGHDWIA